MDEHRKGERRYWLDDIGNVRKLLIGLCLLGLAWALPDFFVHKHEEVDFAGIPIFYAAYGFFACVALVLIAKALRLILMRPEDYYDR